MAPHARLWSGAIATSYSTSSIGSFETTPASTIPVYRQFFQGISGTVADVINSSFGGSDTAATEPESLAIDALAFRNPNVTFVAAAGNSGTAAVSAPGNVYNGITVGSVGGTIGQRGWDYGTVGATGSNDYTFPATLSSPHELQVALNWFARGTFDNATDTGTRSAFANLTCRSGASLTVSSIASSPNRRAATTMPSFCGSR